MVGLNIYTILVFCNCVYGVLPISFKFNCQNTRPSSTRPTSVHKLRPGDIEVVGAIGDSITAGFGLKSTSILNVFIEWRGLVFSVGGDSSLEQGVSTIPNILKEFNPNLYGYSKGSGLLGFPPAERNFNVALTGAEAEGALSQAKQLVSSMKHVMGRFYDVHWKLVTVYIGQNDQCEHCNYNGTFEEFIQTYEDYMKEALDYLHDNLPRALVQVVGIVNPTRFFLDPGVAKTPVCKAVHGFTCDCIADAELRQESDNAHAAMNAALKRLASSGGYDTRDDFTVVYQPTFADVDLPKKPNSNEYDLSYMSHDCFHPNNKLHEIFSAELWKSMLTPVSQKSSENITPREEITLACPSQENPYISTNLNG